MDAPGYLCARCINRTPRAAATFDALASGGSNSGFVKFPLPEVVVTSVDLFGRATTGLALFTVGQLMVLLATTVLSFFTLPALVGALLCPAPGVHVRLTGTSGGVHFDRVIHRSVHCCGQCGQ